MDLTTLKAQRKGLRASFTLSMKKIEAELLKEITGSDELLILRNQISDKFKRLDDCQSIISELLLKDKNAEEAYYEDCKEAENYRDKFIQICSLLDLKFENVQRNGNISKRNFKLPTIELKKFNGEAREFLNFWSQFKKIHEDKSIDNEDKMQHLIQSMEPGSKAERLVLSFPATGENYCKAIQQLKERFGRDDLLVQVYVRDLLRLVMKNAAAGQGKADLPSLYDELEGKLPRVGNPWTDKRKVWRFLDAFG
ncbi:uncharacterized protein LOC129226986 [Uloborus diversus]|uniref:uncharacterized protein LOC129226986 n=1 Tax=Uloborus diversus TaxID=327109 RepID=UPI00240A8A66|nr:uncharacterized protein LOC129226986 [Uloborus diversus]